MKFTQNNHPTRLFGPTCLIVGLKYCSQFHNAKIPSNYIILSKIMKCGDPLYSIEIQLGLEYSQVPIKRVGPNKRVGWLF